MVKPIRDVRIDCQHARRQCAHTLRGVCHDRPHHSTPDQVVRWLRLHASLSYTRHHHYWPGVGCFHGRLCVREYSFSQLKSRMYSSSLTSSSLFVVTPFPLAQSAGLSYRLLMIVVASTPRFYSWCTFRCSRLVRFCSSRPPCSRT